VQKARLTKLYYQHTDGTEKHIKDNTNTMNKITDGEIFFFFLLKLYERTSYEETLKRLEDSTEQHTNKLADEETRW